MATEEITLTTDWLQITDGTDEAAIQVIGGIIYMRDSPTKPGATDKGHVINDWASATAPQQIWIRSPWGRTEVVVTKSS